MAGEPRARLRDSEFRVTESTARIESAVLKQEHT